MLTTWRTGTLLGLAVAACAVLTGAVWLLGRGLDVALLPDQGASWYYWKLPDPTVWTRLSAWSGYLAHQLVAWGLIYFAQTRVRRYAGGLHPVNVVALASHGGFIMLHLIQTQIFYDGLAQDVSIYSSQGSVVLLLIFVLLMESRRRGLVWGRVSLGKRVVDFVRRYHGYLFIWAAVYTFWYHPMAATSGHLIGFFYMFLLLVQGSLFLTRFHTNRWWTLTLELLVAVHGTLVAIMNSGPDGIWPMFLFGFLGVFVLSQMHGLGLRTRTLWIILGVYVLAVAVAYGVMRRTSLDEIIRIPVIEYALVGVLGLLIWAGLAIKDRLAPPGQFHDERHEDTEHRS